MTSSSRSVLLVKLGRSAVHIYSWDAKQVTTPLANAACCGSPLPEAKAEASRIAALMNTGDERRDLLRAEAVAPFQLSLPTAAALFAEAAKLAKLVELNDAVNHLHPIQRGFRPLGTRLQRSGNC